MRLISFDGNALLRSRGSGRCRHSTTFALTTMRNVRQATDLRSVLVANQFVQLRLDVLLIHSAQAARQQIGHLLEHNHAFTHCHGDEPVTPYVLIFDRFARVLHELLDIFQFEDLIHLLQRIVALLQTVHDVHLHLREFQLVRLQRRYVVRDAKAKRLTIRSTFSRMPSLLSS